MTYQTMFIRVIVYKYFVYCCVLVYQTVFVTVIVHQCIVYWCFMLYVLVLLFGLSLLCNKVACACRYACCTSVFMCVALP